MIELVPRVLIKRVKATPILGNGKFKSNMWAHPGLMDNNLYYLRKICQVKKGVMAVGIKNPKEIL